MNNKTLPLLTLSLCALALGACGSSGGSSQPPPPPAPVTPPPPPPPPPEPTFEERLADLAAFDPNPCRAETPGFEALGGWLADDGREPGTSRVWVGDQGALADAESHGAIVWAVFADCAVRFTEDQYAPSVERNGRLEVTVWDEDKARGDDRDVIVSRSSSPPYDDIELPEPDSRWSNLLPHLDGAREEGQRILQISAAGNGDGLRTGHLQNASFQWFLSRHETALHILVGGYVGEGEERAPSADSSICSDADPLCLFAPWRSPAISGSE